MADLTIRVPGPSGPVNLLAHDNGDSTYSLVAYSGAATASSATATVTSVADAATSATLLAANAARLGATIFNDSTVDLYVKLGTTASATSFTVKLTPGAYYEVPYRYTGRIDGIWASDASGSARITELT
jgi:hypothetical protein